ncbi:MAG: hypothetical protein B0A82_07935 [Alkalinema sp. CACIAM 70d]|nr:MAG: hypothetical protein B0A82_07935 [Alkalinema sp. CACIAM 70d]
MTLTTPRRMSLEDYLNYDDGTDTRYELVDGVLVKIAPENPLNPQIAMFLAFAFGLLGLPPHRIVIGHQIAMKSPHATARQPDLVVHSEASEMALRSGSKILTLDMPAPLLVVEVVSSSQTDPQSYDRDYQQKRAEYADRGIGEYWIVDPEASLVTVCNLTQATYQSTEFRGDSPIVSVTFPSLSLTANRILTAGK